jgi:hypothetical protein
VTSVAYSPNGRTVASGSRDFTVLVWDVTGFQTGGGLIAIDLNSEQLDQLWKSLAEGDAVVAQRATWSLVAAGKTSVPFLKAHLQPIESVAKRQITRWIDDLNDNNFATREKATDELEKIAEIAIPALRKAIEAPDSPEAARRAAEIMEKLDWPITSGRRLREIRAVAALEQMNSKEARELLERLATGLSEARMTQDAKASLERQSKRSDANR